MVQQNDRRTAGGNITALYCHLSQGRICRRVRQLIQHQKQILMEYANANGFPTHSFCGRRLFRSHVRPPGYKAMMEQVEAGMSLPSL